MSRCIPFLSGPDGIEVPGYVRFKNLKELFAGKTAAYLSRFKLNEKQKAELKKFAGYCGYGKDSRFLDRLKNWIELKENVPMCVLTYLDLDRTEIESAVKNDLRDFLSAAAMPVYPATYTVRLMAAVYNGGEVPRGMDEEKARRYVRRLLDERGLHTGFCLNFPELKTVFVERDGSIHTVWYPPEIAWTKTHLIAGRDGRRTGKSSIG